MKQNDSSDDLSKAAINQHPDCLMVYDIVIIWVLQSFKELLGFLVGQVSNVGYVNVVNVYANLCCGMKVVFSITSDYLSDFWETRIHNIECFDLVVI